MGKDDWISFKGWKYRAEGMHKKEKKSDKICYLMLWLGSAIVYFTLFGIHLERAINANRVNETFEPRRRSGWKRNSYQQAIMDANTPPAYDTCQIPYFKKSRHTKRKKF